MLGVRDLLVKQRTMLINAIRGHAAEFGLTVAKGPKQVSELVHRLANDDGMPALAREMIGVLAVQLDELEIELKAIEKQLMAWHRQDQPRDRANRRRQLCSQGGRFESLSLGPALLPLGWASHRAKPRLPGDRSSEGSAAPVTRTCGDCW